MQVGILTALRVLLDNVLDIVGDEKRNGLLVREKAPRTFDATELLSLPNAIRPSF